jgi:hypothetical protein
VDMLKCSSLLIKSHCGGNSVKETRESIGVNVTPTIMDFATSIPGPREVISSNVFRPSLIMEDDSFGDNQTLDQVMQLQKLEELRLLERLKKPE